MSVVMSDITKALGVTVGVTYFMSVVMSDITKALGVTVGAHILCQLSCQTSLKRWVSQ